MSPGTSVSSAAPEWREACMKALIFDCDGVIADTERDGHRVAFNEAFRSLGLATRWSAAEYGELLATAGGKERLRLYFEKLGWPEAAGGSAGHHDAFILELHQLKTDFYMQIIEQGRLPLRPGVARLIDEALDAGMDLAIASTSHERAVRRLAEVMLGPKRVVRFKAILAGDVVARKKPDPEIYRLASSRLQRDPGECVVIEDSRNGLLAAKAAGMWCLVTTSSYTVQEDFHEADRVVAELGDPPGVQISLRELQGLCRSEPYRGPAGG
jgi:HAD superfamily hydrolase (TIGR01509 family)